MNLVAIDIGSNAIRFQFSIVSTYKKAIIVKKVEYIRFPLCLGHDVFQKQRISKKNEKKFLKLLKAFKLLIQLYAYPPEYDRLWLPLSYQGIWV